MFFEVEFDLKVSALIGNSSRRQSSRADVKRHMPPMVYAWMHCETDLAYNLQIKMQRVFGRPPLVKRHCGKQFSRSNGGLIHKVILEPASELHFRHKSLCRQAATDHFRSRVPAALRE